jgi:hypothetical protein
MKRIFLLAALLLIVTGCTACVMPANTEPQYQAPNFQNSLEVNTRQPSPTYLPTATLLPSLTPIPTITPTETIAVTPTPLDLAAMKISRDDQMTVIEDVTFPDNSEMKPAELFLKTWRVENRGTKTWNNQYLLTFVQEENTYNGPVATKLMFYPPDTSLGWNIGSWPEPLAAVKPGEIVDITIILQTPNKHGYQFGSWTMINDEGEKLADPLWSQLQVNGTIPEEQIGWNGTWVINDPFLDDPAFPVTLSLENNEQWVRGYFYNHFGDTIVISGRTSEDQLLVDGLFGFPNQRVGGTALLLQFEQNRKTFRGTVYDNETQINLCAARDKNSYITACLPKETETHEPTQPTTQE